MNWFVINVIWSLSCMVASIYVIILARSVRQKCDQLEYLSAELWQKVKKYNDMKSMEWLTQEVPR